MGVGRVRRGVGEGAAFWSALSGTSAMPSTLQCAGQTVLPSRQLWHSPWCEADELSGHSLEVLSLGTLDSQTPEVHTELCLPGVF